jgi:hypothetical protein
MVPGWFNKKIYKKVLNNQRNILKITNNKIIAIKISAIIEICQ